MNTNTKADRLSRKIEKNNALMEAIIKGIQRANDFNKQYDKAIMIKVAMKEAGFTHNWNR